MSATQRIEASTESLAGTPVHDELCARIAQLDRDFRALSISELGSRVDAIRKIARTHGFEPVSRLAAGLGDMLARGGRGPSVRPYLDSLRDAAGYPQQDEATARAFMAAVHLRLVG